MIVNIRRDERGYTIFDAATGEPIEYAGKLQVGLHIEEADDLANWLNFMEQRTTSEVTPKSR